MKCARQRCRAPIEQPATGRRRATCSDACRAALYRTRQRAGHSSVHFSSESSQHYTPPGLFAELAAELGPFDLDPCADPRSPIWPLVPNHYTEADDGLAYPWTGRVWLNPPYGRGPAGIAAWMTKAAAEVRAGRASIAVCLVPARTDTRWWTAAIAAGGVPRFLPGRLRFVQTDGRPAESGAPFPSAVVVFRDGRRVTKRARGTR